MSITSQFVSKQRIVLVKKETSYGDDPTPTLAANAIEVENLKIDYPPDVLERDLLHEDISPSAPATGKRFATISFDCELKGSGTAGTPGRISPLLQSCRMEENTDAGVSVIYHPGPLNNSCTIYVYDVNITTSGDYMLHKFKGCVGNVSFEFKAGQIIKAKFTFQAIYTKPSDAADPGNPTYESSSSNPIVMKGGTLTFDTASLIIESLIVDLNNQIAERPDVTNANSIAGFVVTGRKPSGSINPEQTLIAEYDPFDDIEDKNKLNLSLSTVLTTGYTLLLSGCAVTIDKLSLADRNGLGIFDLPIRFNRVSGNDEFHLHMT